MVKWIMKAITSGLAHIHANGVVHRDLKLENVLIDEDKKVIKIIDFGLSKKTAQSHESGLLIGTMDYIAPEIFYKRGSPNAYAPPCDMWALGLIGYKLFSGINPMSRNDRE